MRLRLAVSYVVRKINPRRGAASGFKILGNVNRNLALQRKKMEIATF
jgi:hypothetical protein